MRKEVKSCIKINKSVEIGSYIVNDENIVYRGFLNKAYQHSTVNHNLDKYSTNGLITNEIESIEASMKRGYKRVYYYWSSKCLHKYFNETTFRLSKKRICENRKMKVNLTNEVTT